ncbi:hypothetical protein [Mycobacterium servetii]|uniref:Uncharacterized protein n=1 Tax=Mycobacterium servetii TaxID=3237418 RepID=A0ABV4C2G3_9MYCO
MASGDNGDAPAGSDTGPDRAADLDRPGLPGARRRPEAAAFAEVAQRTIAAADSISRRLGWTERAS